MFPLPVGQEDLKCLCHELYLTSNKWFSLGIQLQVPIETLKCIRMKNLTMTECMPEMLADWLKCTDPYPTWDILAEALESPAVGERRLAQQLRDKYCTRTEGAAHHYLTRSQGVTSHPSSLPPTQGNKLGAS